MEITNEIKAKIFAQYLGQEFKWSEETDEDYTPILSAVNIGGSVFSEEADDSGEGCYSINECKLILKPLSAITDEDAIEVAKLIFGKSYNQEKGHDQLVLKKCQAEAFIKTMNDTPLTGRESWFIYQFLQSHEYDLPQYLLGGKTLKECDLAIYETE